jgi:ABC-type multidrug transport system fused ATPase/permease subunit
MFSATIKIITQFLFIIKSASPKFKFQGSKLLIFIFFGVVVDLIGLSLIPLYFNWVSDLTVFRDFSFIKHLIFNLGLNSDVILVLFLSLIVLLITILKFATLTRVMKKQIKFTYDLQQALSKRVIESYLGKTYGFLSSTNSSLIIRNTISEVNVLTTGFLNSLFLITEILVCLCIFFFLAYTDWRSTIFIFFLFGTTAILFVINSRTKILNLSRIRVEEEGNRLRSLQEAIGLMKEVKRRSLEGFFVSKIDYHAGKGLRAASQQAYLTQLPRIIIDLIAVTSIIALVCFFYFKNYGTSEDGNFSEILIFAAAAYRVMPSINKILISITNIQSAVKSSAVIYDILLSKNNEKNIQMGRISFYDKLHFNSVSFCYEGASDPVFTNLDLIIQKGEFVGIYGQSGSGKSTLIDLLMGFQHPTSGSILVDNFNIHDGLQEWRNCIGYVPQKAYLIDDSIKRNVALGVDDNLIDIPWLMNVLMQVQLGSFISNLPNGIETIVGEDGSFLSGGQIQRLVIARALYFSPQLLILDESTNSLDFNTEREILNLLLGLKGTITLIFIKHGAISNGFFDKIFSFDNKRLVQP